MNNHNAASPAIVFPMKLVFLLINWSSVNVNLKAQLILPRIEKSSQLNEIKLLFIEKNDIRRFEN